ncbi:MAG: hypothetical protein C4557_06430 [Anaerolineaceae bacterium]|jgi:hypothetical protein|nr:MAG: hypothetical protein C4557_06430 [Anaerolineaceae bacterium]
MSTNSFFAKFLRFIGILLMGLTGGVTLLGGIGTTCAALFPTNYESMAALAPLQWLYILFVITGIAIGVWGIWATIKLVKGMSDSYKMSLQALVAGVVIGFIHIYTSRALRGASMPVDAVVYITMLTLVIFLLFRIPSIWQGVDFTKARTKDNLPAGGATAISLGIMTLTIQYTMASTHTWGGVNYADVFNTSMTIIGVGLLLLGVGLFVGAAKVWETGNRLQVQKRSA